MTKYLTPQHIKEVTGNRRQEPQSIKEVEL